METTFTFGACLVGGIIDTPVFNFTNNPLNTATAVEHINTLGTTVSQIAITGNVTYQVTGNSVDGIGSAGLGAVGGAQQVNQVLPPTEIGFTGTIGGPV